MRGGREGGRGREVRKEDNENGEEKLRKSRRRRGTRRRRRRRRRRKRSIIPKLDSSNISLLSFIYCAKGKKIWNPIGY